MKHIVTGGTGFIGSTLVNRLLEEGHQVVVIDNFSSSGGELLQHHKGNDSLEILSGDISYIKTQTDLPRILPWIISALHTWSSPNSFAKLRFDSKKKKYLF